MSLAFLYAGQGSQKVGMGREMYERYPAFRAVWDAAPVDFDLKQLCWEGPEKQLSQTRYTQPCLLAFAAGVTAVLREQGVTPDCAAGLSLGEYSALQAAGVWSAADAISLVAFRGQAMEQAVTGRPCGMYAVLQLDRDKLEQVCQECAGEGVCTISNYNCPGQLVIAGDKAAVDAACTLAKERGARRCLPLKVSGPFHTALMEPAAQQLEEKFKSVSFGQPAFPVYFNCIAAPAPAGESIPALLVRQVKSPVYWEDTLRAMVADGVTAAIEIGPGRTLSGFARKTVPQLPVFSIETPEELKEAVKRVKEVQA